MFKYYFAITFNKAEELFLRYFDLKSKCARKEFNYTLFLMSFVVMGTFYLFSDLQGLSQYSQESMVQFAEEVMANTPNAETLTQDQIMEKFYESESSKNILTGAYDFLPPVALVYALTLLFLPLYYRRINDSILDNATLIPVAAYYVIDFIGALFNINVAFPGYNILSIYSFVMSIALMMLPSETKETEGY